MDSNNIKYKSKMTAWVLHLALGWVGAGDFYLGFTKRAIFKIILTITLFGSVISVIWSIFDAINIMDNKATTDVNGIELK